jgi:hypothetical protein
MSNAQLVTDDQITLVIDGKIITVPRSHISFHEIKNLLLNEEPTPWGLIKELSDASYKFKEWGNGIIRVKDGVLTYHDRSIHNTIAHKIVQGIEEGQNVTPFANFLTNLMNNPSRTSVDELYLFIEKAKLPITEDGHFLAYKNVKENYTDRHTGTFDNRVGQVCSVPRNSVDDNRDNTCSNGLHFCALDYLRGFWGFSGHTMIVKINPADVVSIPSDYDNAKGRTSRYEVVGEVGNGEAFDEDFSNDSVWDEYIEDDGWEEVKF